MTCSDPNASLRPATSTVTLAAVGGPSPSTWSHWWSQLNTPSHTNGLRHLVLSVPCAQVPVWLAALPACLAPSAPVAPAHWPVDLPLGFHRLHLGAWSLTLCVGSVEHSVAQWQCQAQHVWLDVEHTTQLPELARALARQCARNACLTLAHPPSSTQATAWAQAGFQPSLPAAPGLNGWQATYAPRWPVPPMKQLASRHALVIGAGLTGAALCQSLTRRGWQVDLLDQGSAPAQGASGLPVGMLSAHVTARDTPLSLMTRSGEALHRRELQRLVPEGAGWQASCVSNLRTTDSDEGEKDAALDTLDGANAPGGEDATVTEDAWTHAPQLNAAVVRPAALVLAWLAEAQATGLLRTHWGCHVQQLCSTSPNTLPSQWQALDANGDLLAQAPVVVVAAAYGSQTLLQAASQASPADLPLRPVKGQLSYGVLTGPAPAPHPLRDHGVLVPSFEDQAHPDGPRLWAMGSTYERNINNTEVTEAAHQRNLASLEQMLPEAGVRMRQQHTQGQLMGWAQVRCASQDRLPLVGPAPQTSVAKPSMKLHDVPRVPGLWTLCALGSRGLSLSMLGAELLVAKLNNEPWPLEKSLADALDPARFALKQSRLKKTNQ